MKLTITADVYAKPEYTEVLIPFLNELVQHTLEEEGYIEYSLHQDNEDKNHFLFYEIWETKALWNKHLEKSHIQNFMKQTEHMIENFDVKQLSELN